MISDAASKNNLPHFQVAKTVGLPMPKSTIKVFQNSVVRNNQHFFGIQPLTDTPHDI